MITGVEALRVLSGSSVGQRDKSNGEEIHGEGAGLEYRGNRQQGE